MITDFQLMQIENFLLKNPDKKITIGDLDIVILNKKHYEECIAKINELIENEEAIMKLMRKKEEE